MVFFSHLNDVGAGVTLFIWFSIVKVGKDKSNDMVVASAFFLCEQRSFQLFVDLVSEGGVSKDFFVVALCHHVRR